MGEVNVNEIKTLNGYPLADTKARADIAALTEEIAEIKNGNTFEEEGDFVEVDLGAGTTVNVISTFTGKPTWENRVRLHQVNSNNLHDFVARFGGAGATHSKGGLTAVVNGNSTITITGKNTTGGWVNIIDSIGATPYSSYLYPPGTYTLSPGITAGCNNYDGTKSFGNKNGTFTMSEHFKLYTIYIAYAAGVDVNETIPLVFVRGTTLPQSNLEYSGVVYEAKLPNTSACTEGKFDWSTGKLYDMNGNYLEEATEMPHVEGLLGKNRFWNNLYTSGMVKVTCKYAATIGAGVAGGTADKFAPEEWGLPVLHLTGDVAAMNKDNAVDMQYVYGLREGTCSVKWQGSSSIAYKKKNYTIKFDAAFEAVEGWTEQKKYCLKANYIDHSHARNVVNAKLWGQIVKSRSTVPTELASLPNAGAVDGFPCLITLNGEFIGLYTFNIPKDGWMYGMGNGAKECILCAGNSCPANGFKEAATLEGENDLEIEYITDENNTAWAKTSVNNLINACINSDGSDLDTTIASMLDWQSAIDYYIFTVLVAGHDMTQKNYLLSTFDGVKWFFGAYDMDCTYGLHWDGSKWLNANIEPTFNSFASIHRAMELIKLYKKDALKARYAELRETVLSESNIATEFANFCSQIPKPVYLQDAKKWPMIPNTSTNDITQIRDYYRMRVAYADKWIEQL